MTPLASPFVITLAVASNVVHGQQISERAEKDQVTFMQDEAPEMINAFRKAQATLDSFLTIAASPPPNTSSFAVKVGVREGKNTEYFWMNELTRVGEEFVGKINNEPRIAKSVKFGQAYTFSRAKIVDWTYVDIASRKTFGNFTACALLSREPSDQAAAFKKQYGLECE